MHPKVSFHWMCAHKYVRLVLTMPSLDMQIFILPMIHGAHTLPWKSFYVRWYLILLPLLPTAPICLHWGVQGERNHKFCSVWKTWRHSPKKFAFSVVGPLALVHYIPKCTKDNKIQSCPSLSLPDSVFISLSYVFICTSSPASQDAPLAYLLVEGLFFKPLEQVLER